MKVRGRMLYTFNDYYDNQVMLSFEDHPFTDNPKHILVICKYENHWLLTKHKNRGLEFPGGNVESGETAEQAAYREVMEETGAIIEQLIYVGQYKVAGKARTVIKNVYVAYVEQLIQKDTYYETDGPHLCVELPQSMQTNPSYSFMMKDEIIPRCIQYIEEYIQT